ncbi:MAG TPA: TylF/MycF/NovP-related O-methyltransferase [Bacteroidales bacterium]|nr:TylF/MycF/NovP-related O-methyltransferase [Bacteroidales bacterium]
MGKLEIGKNGLLKSSCTIEQKFEHFTKYVRRQRIARFLACYEIFKLQMHIKGSIVECGVHQGNGVMTWAKISSTLEPYNYQRKIIGFDTFAGFPAIQDADLSTNPNAHEGFFNEDYDVYEEMKLVIKEYDCNRFINQISKIELVKGDANKTIPEYLKKNHHTLVSLLFLDFDIYQPTITALEHFLPRMSKGSILAFDELNNPDWPGETQAVLEKFDLNKYPLKCFEFEPNISYIEIGGDK